MSMNIEAIVMPKLGLSMTEGTVAQWHVKVGAEISPGDVIADIETSKITNELEVHTAGIIKKILVKEGVELPVGALLSVIADASVPEADIDQFITAFVPENLDSMELLDAGPHGMETVKTAKTETESKKSRAANAAVDIPDSLQGNDDDDAVPATQLARKLARRFSINLNKVSGTGRRNRISKQDIERAVMEAGGKLPVSTTDKDMPDVQADDTNVPATPLARRMAKHAGIKLRTVTPTGSRSRVTKADIESVIASSGKAGGGRGATATSATGDYIDVPLTPIRRIIAERLTASKHEAPHFRLTIEANIDQMLKLRTDLNHDMDGTKVSVNDLLIKAVAEALIKVPEVNIQFDGDVIRRFVNADVAVAVALHEGLVTPIIRAADKKSIVAISSEIAGLVARAKTGSLLPDEFEGGTFTLSNLGMFGIKTFDAIINPPQAAILAVGTGEKRRIFSGDKEIVATLISATASCDHRVIDGATGARFMQVLQEIIEHPYRMLM